MKIKQASSIVVNNKIYERKKSGYDLITLSLGESFFQLPTFTLNIDDSVNHYVETLGLYDLRSNLSRYYLDSKIIVHPDSVLITSGAKLGVLEALMAFKSNTGNMKRVGYFEPAWVSYSEQIKLVDAIPVAFDISQFSILSDEDFINLDCIIINNPHNPSGKLFSEIEIRNFYTKCLEFGISIIFDEVYSEFTDGFFFSGANLLKNSNDINVVVINSLSKNFGMSGWRIGYCLFNESIKQDLISIHQHTMTCASVPLQRLLADNFEMIRKITRPQIDNIIIKRALVVDYLKKMNFNVLEGTSTFYIFVSHQLVENFDNLFDSFLENGVAVVPGSGYGSDYRNYMRISVGTESVDRIRNAIDIIKRIIEE